MGKGYENVLLGAKPKKMPLERERSKFHRLVYEKRLSLHHKEIKFHSHGIFYLTF